MDTLSESSNSWTKNKKVRLESKNLQAIKATLIEEFQNKCAYCGSKLGLTSRSEIDQFYPKSIYPDKAYEIDNLLLTCNVCNVNKGNQFPLDEKGLPLLLNPRFDNFYDHMKIEKNGLVTHLTKRGFVTIEILKLNRTSLVEERKLINLEKIFFENLSKVRTNYFFSFSKSIKTIREVNNFSNSTKNNIKEHLRNMLFANVITSLESFLSDAFINTVKSNKEYVRKFVETYHNFKNEKFEYKDLFQYYESIDEKVTKAMLDVIYHDLKKVRGMYYDTLQIKFPEFYEIFKAVTVRHDLVHRNGKTKDGKIHKIENKDIEKLCDEVESFVKDINIQLIKLSSKSR